MLIKPRTIQIFLPTGDPRGIRIAALTTNSVQVLEIPRALLTDFQLMSESKQVGLYLPVVDDAAVKELLTFAAVEGAGHSYAESGSRL